MANMTTAAGILKNVYDTYVEKMQNLSHLTIDDIGKSSKSYNAGGAGFFGAINDYGNESGGAQNESDAFNTVDSEHYVQWKVVPKLNIWPIEFSGLLADAAEGDPESFANAVVEEIDMARERLRADENRQFFGIGTGALASPAGAVASNATSMSVTSTQYLRANMVVDGYTGATRTITAIRISQVDPVNKVVYFATSLGAALGTTDTLVKQNIRVSAASDGKEMMGLRGIVDDSTDLQTFQAVDASANYIWRALRIDASAANLTSDLLQRLEDDVSIQCGTKFDTYITHQKQRRKYLDLVTPEKRFADLKMDAGFESLSFNGKEFRLDKDCQTDTVYGITKAQIRKFELSPMKMGGYDGSDKYLRKAGYDVFQAYWRHVCNFGTARRNSHGKLTNLAVPTGGIG